MEYSRRINISNGQVAADKTNVVDARILDYGSVFLPSQVGSSGKTTKALSPSSCFHENLLISQDTGITRPGLRGEVIMEVALSRLRSLLISHTTMIHSWRPIHNMLLDFLLMRQTLYLG